MSFPPDKKDARLIVSQIFLDALNELGMSYPAVNKDRRKQLLSVRKLLESNEPKEQ